MALEWELRPDQIEDLAKLMQNPRWIMGGEPGTGKTPTICVMQRYLWDHHQTGTIWAMPLSLLKKNREEALRFGGWDPADVVIVDGTPAQVQVQMLMPAKVFLMGFARFAKILKEGKFPERFRAMHTDEHHKGFSGHDSSRTGALYEFMKQQGKWFVPATGTIINGKLDTAYPAIQIIEPRYYGSFDGFKNRHHQLDMWTGKRIGFQDHAHLQEILQAHGSFSKWKDIFGNEQKVIQVELVEMEAEQKVLYKKFEKDALLELEQFFIDGTMPGVAFHRARQIMEIPNHFPDLRFPNSKATVDIIPGRRPGKLERLELHLTDHFTNGTPFVIFAPLIKQQLQIFELCESLGIKTGLLVGASPPRQRAQTDEAFRAGVLQGIVASDQVADAGFNWQFWGPNKQEVGHCIFAALNYVDTTFFQAYRRFLRETRLTPLRITVMKYVDSLDFRIAEINNRKSYDAKLIDPHRELLRL